MALDDLDLEFEDEDEQKKDDALEVDVDLNFSAAGNSPGGSHAAGKTPARAPQSASVKNAPAENKEDSVPKQAKPKASIAPDDVTDPNLRIPKNIQSANNTANASSRSATPSPGTSNSTPKGQGQVTSLDAARRNAANKNQAAQAKVVDQRQAQGPPQSQPTPSPSGEAFADVDYQNEMSAMREEIKALKEEVRSIEKSADVRVAVAEAKTEFITEYMSNAKLMDHQVNQILQRIHTKVPQLKNEVLTIKKFMSEFIKKSSGKK